MVLHNGDPLVDGPFDPSQQPPFFTITEREGEAFGTSSRCATDAVNVIFGFHRQVEVDDVRDVVDVDASVYDHVYLPEAPETNVASTKVELRPVIDGVTVWLISPPPN